MKTILGNHQIIELVRMIAVIALVVAAAALATPKGRLPLAVRGVMRILRRDRGLQASAEDVKPVSSLKRFIAFIIVLVAALVALV